MDIKDNNLIITKFDSTKKKNKIIKNISLLYKKITFLEDHINYLFKNKFINQELYIEKMYILNEIQNKIINFDVFLQKKKFNKNVIENLYAEINEIFIKVTNKSGSNTCKNTIDLYMCFDDYYEMLNNEYKLLFNLYDQYFIPLSVNKIIDYENFIKKYNIESNNPIIVFPLIEYSKNNTLIEKVDGATIIFKYNNNECIYINGFFKKDSLNICKNILNFKKKSEIIEDELEYISVPDDFKIKYYEQLSIRDFIILTPKEIANMIMLDYEEFLNYKNKSLSILIKEFIKSNFEKQRKIIMLFLLSDQESQFTAHIIFDLITDKSFLSESNSLSDALFNSLHWKLQQIFKISEENFDINKKKLENTSINDIPYESRILSMKANDQIKLKAMEKLKEINGSKESSIKAQQWLDGLLKIPFNIFKKEPIIDFFKNYQVKMEKYIDIFTIKISEYDYDNLNNKNKLIYNIIIQIIDEFHSTIHKSENSYSCFIKYLNNIKLNIHKELLNKNNNKNTDELLNIYEKIKKNNNNLFGNLNTVGVFEDSFENINLSDTDFESIKIQTVDSYDIDYQKKKKIEKDSLFLLNNNDNNFSIINKIIDKKILPSENTVNDCINQLQYFKKIKKELYENDIISKSNLAILIKKLNELENMLNLNLLKNESENDEYDENDEYGEEDEVENISFDNNYIDLEKNNIEKIEKNKNYKKYFIEGEDNIYNYNFKKYIIKNMYEINNLIKDWENFILNKKIYMNDVDKILDKCTYGQINAKNQMKRIIGQWMNGNTKGQCFGLCGPPGVGKTTLCKNGLAKCLFDENGESRPFAFLPLGGATNGSILEGHHYTYVGSTWGRIIDILIETKCMNPIIYIDELDKISKTEHGREIVSILTHITDQSQNKEYYDRYFASIPIDLSQVLFIFSYNDRDNIDRILRDRIQEISITALSTQEKLIISNNYILPEILNNVGFSSLEIIFNNEILTKIINQYTYEAGVRKLNEILYDIIRDINLKKIMDSGEKDNINELKYPIIINDEIAYSVLSTYTKITEKKIGNVPKVGLVNGLYATSAGLGGITIIQVLKTISDKKLSLEKLTGNQGDVMKESMNCALTLAWNIIPNNIKKKLNENDSNEGFGLHIHCPESSTPKDGPSAGLAITTAIISRITGIPIKNDIAMTGEVDLMGKACEIGGLHSKLQGALNAGVKVVLIPTDNKKDLDIIFKKEEEENKSMQNSNFNKNIIDDFFVNNNNNHNNHENINLNKIFFRNKLEIILVNNIFEVLNYTLIENDIKFNNDF